MNMKSLVLAVSALMVAGLSHAGEPMTVEEVARAARDGVTFVDNDYISARQAANPELLLLDVRSEGEFSMGHIPGARSMARGVAEFRMAETVRDADAEIILYCATGARAALVQKALAEQGYRNVSAHEGFDTWAAAGLPVENTYGTFRLIERKRAD
ncbi:rhodanese-like domain-containing protein [Hyphomonas sp.]|uniref:rhodanese-like domain-containing protein n=1 Tax=Hyphomonas sp. TaxID=87 RepID=UPI00391DE6E5